jgi:hypothetical protein
MASALMIVLVLADIALVGPTGLGAALKTGAATPTRAQLAGMNRLDAVGLLALVLFVAALAVAAYGPPRRPQWRLPATAAVVGGEFLLLIVLLVERSASLHR